MYSFLFYYTFHKFISPNPSIMKKYMLSLVFIALAIVSPAQVPQAFNYQAILRNPDGTVKVEESVTVQIIIRHYQE